MMMDRMLARDIMTQPVITVREETTLDEVARTMLDRRIGCVPVVDGEGRLRGIVTESDFCEKQRCVPLSTFRFPQLFGRWMSREGVEAMFAEARKIPAAQIMTRDVVVAAETDPVREVMARMLNKEVNRIPVVRDGVPIGIVARHDVLKMMVRDRI
jgi:CBS domain-containing protein